MGSEEAAAAALAREGEQVLGRAVRCGHPKPKTLAPAPALPQHQHQPEPQPQPQPQPQP